MKDTPFLGTANNPLKIDSIAAVNQMAGAVQAARTNSAPVSVMYVGFTPTELWFLLEALACFEKEKFPTHRNFGPDGGESIYKELRHRLDLFEDGE